MFLCTPILIHKLFSYPEKENQALRNEIEELKNDDLSKNQHVSIRSLNFCVLLIFSCNLQGFQIV